MPLHLDYYYGDEAEQYSFYRIPKVLFTDSHYSDLSVEARVLYGLMLDRMGLSAKNGWMDSLGRVYIFFTLEDAISLLNTGHNKAVRLFKELEDVGLIERKKQGQGKPTVIYVKNFILPEQAGQFPPQPDTPPETSRNRKSALPLSGKPGVQTSQNRKSAFPETGGQDFPKGERNNTERNHTESNETDLSIPPLAPPRQPRERRTPQQTDVDRIEQMEQYREIIRENIDYDVLLHDNPHDADLIDGYVELMVDAVCGSSPTIRVSKQDMPAEVVRSRFLKLGKEHIEYVLDCMKKNTTRIGNIKAYMLSALYNAPVTIGQYFTSLVSRDMAAGFAAG